MMTMTDQLTWRECRVDGVDVRGWKWGRCWRGRVSKAVPPVERKLLRDCTYGIKVCLGPLDVRGEYTSLVCFDRQKSMARDGWLVWYRD